MQSKLVNAAPGLLASIPDAGKLLDTKIYIGSRVNSKRFPWLDKIVLLETLHFFSKFGIELRIAN